MSKFDVAALTWDEKPMRVEIAKAVAEGVKQLIPLRREFRTLDFGCGTGLVSFFLSKEVGEIIGVDNSKGMIDVFNRKAKENNLKATAYQVDILKEDFQLGEFDLILSSMTFHHIENPPQLIRKLKNHLKDGGYIAIADLVKEDGTFHEDNEGVEHFGFYPEEFSRYLEDSGFSQIKHTIVFKVEKEREGIKREYPIFLITGKVSRS